MGWPEVCMIIYLTICFIVPFVDKRPITLYQNERIVGAFIKTMFFILLLYYGGFWN
jgi:hypothetical protein